MKSLSSYLRRFRDLVRSDGLFGAAREAAGKPGRMLIRPAMREVARVEGELEAAVTAIGRAEAHIQTIEAADVVARLAQLDTGLREMRRAQDELDARAARLEADTARLDQATVAFERHARSLVAIAEWQAAMQSLLPVPAPPEGAPLVSVVMPTRNRAGDLRAAIRSVQAQSWPHWELIVVDDGSTDQTRDLLGDLASGDARIRWFSQPQQGHAAARNAAVERARGDVVAYLDDDNEYFPEYLAAVARAFAEDPGLEMSYAAQLWVGAGPASMVTFDRYSWEDLRDMRMSIDLNAMAHRMSLRSRAGGFDPQLLRHADLDLALRYAAKTVPRRIPVMAVRYRWNDESSVSNTMSSAAALHRIREKYAEPIGRGLRVLFVTYNYPQLSESYIHAEIRWMVSRGVEIEVYAQQVPVSMGEATVPVHYADLASAVERFRPDVIHVHWLSLARQYATDLERFGVPVTVKGHGFDHTDELASALVAEPWLAKLYLFDNLPQTGLAVLPKLGTFGCAVDTSRYYPVYEKDRRLVLRAGACLPTKDLGMFIEVAAICPEFRFVLVLSTNESGRDTDRELRERNEELGRPVEIQSNLQYGPMAALMRRAGLYLHTFGFTQPFGQPVSVAEAMAAGTIPLLRRAAATRAYARDAALYYESVQDAARILREVTRWDDQRWAAAQLACVDLAYANHADSRVLEPMLRDWLALRGATRRAG